jgi:esterase/lipase
MTMVEKIEQMDWKTIETPPIALVQGQFDKITDPINAINFINSIKTKDKELWWYPNMWSCWIF